MRITNTSGPGGPFSSIKTFPQEEGAVVAERELQQVKPPPSYQVVLINDDFTPMEFVIDVLQEFFDKDRDMATQIMLRVHLEGRGVCGIYSREIAETKVALVMDAAAEAGHPLQCLAEPVGE